MRSSHRQPSPPESLVLDLSQRVSPDQLSLAWGYLSMNNPNLPVPSSLQHLTPLEWELVGSALMSAELQRQASPVH